MDLGSGFCFHKLLGVTFFFFFLLEIPFGPALLLQFASLPFTYFFFVYKSPLWVTVAEKFCKVIAEKE